jgi:hypothetical protein
VKGEQADEDEHCTAQGPTQGPCPCSCPARLWGRLCTALGALVAVSIVVVDWCGLSGDGRGARERGVIYGGCGFRTQI